MSRLRRRVFASSLILGVVVLVGSGAALLRAQTGGDPVADPAPSAPSGVRGEPFNLYPADDGALAWDDHVEGTVPSPTEEEIASGSMTAERAYATSRETKAGVLAVQEWAEADHAPAVHAAYSTYSQLMAAEAELKRAEYEAGLSGIGETGIGETGVEP